MSAHQLYRSSDPDTSRQAAERAASFCAAHQQRIVDCLREHGPLGKDAIAALLSLDGVSVARRLPELQRAGAIRPTGKTVLSDSGRAEREWEAC